MIISFLLILFLTSDLNNQVDTNKIISRTYFAIKGGKIYTSGASGILKDAFILIENGKIREISQAKHFSNVKVIDYSEKYIMPGIIDGHSYLSGYYRLLENTEAITSDLIAYVAFNPFHHEVQEAISHGITTVHFVPRNDNLVGGITSIFKLKREANNFDFLKKQAFLKISFSSDATCLDRPPTSLVGAPVILSRILKNIKDSYSNERNEIFQQKGLYDLLAGKIRPIIFASFYEEISMAIKWLSDWKMKGVIVGGEESHLHLDSLKKMNIPVLLSPLTCAYPDIVAKNIASLIQNGLKIGFVSHMPEGDAYGLRLSASILCHHGITSDEAIKTITIFPAQILGIDQIVGSIEEGKDADLIIFSGEPLNLSSKIEAVYSNGELIYKNSK